MKGYGHCKHCFGSCTDVHMDKCVHGCDWQMPSDEALMDAWWTAMDDDWAVPDWAPGKFLREVMARGYLIGAPLSEGRR